jgi:DNA-binding NarL/FixJ family response regulator
MGYIMKQEASEVIVKAIKTVLSKQLYASEIKRIDS